MDALAGQPYGGVFFVDGWPDKVVSVFKRPPRQSRSSAPRERPLRAPSARVRQSESWHIPLQGIYRPRRARQVWLRGEAVVGKEDGRHVEEERSLVFEALQEPQRKADAREGIGFALAVLLVLRRPRARDFLCRFVSRSV